MSPRSWLDAHRSEGYLPGLDRVRHALSLLGDPQLSFPSIHVAGTNGKGSACASMAYLLQLRMEGPIGFFSSPHLCKIEERIRIDGRPVDGWVLDDALRHVRRVCESDPDLRLSFYELTFLLAMTVFKQLGVVRAVVETGLGGRLDPTCLVDADACLVTMIGMDHSEVLGENLSDIAMEKATIRRPGRPFLALLPETMEVQQAIRDGAGWDDGCRWVEVGHLGPILHERADPLNHEGPTRMPRS